MNDYQLPYYDKLDPFRIFVSENDVRGQEQNMKQ